MSCDGTSLCFVAARLLGELQLQCLFKAEHVEQTCDHISAAIGARPRQTCIPRRARTAPRPTQLHLKRNSHPSQPTREDSNFQRPTSNAIARHIPRWKSAIRRRSAGTTNVHTTNVPRCGCCDWRAPVTRVHIASSSRAPSATLSVNNRAVLDQQRDDLVLIRPGGAVQGAEAVLVVAVC